MAFISQIESKKVDEALKDEYWIMAMQEKLNQFERSNMWELVLYLEDRTIIETK